MRVARAPTARTARGAAGFRTAASARVDRVVAAGAAAVSVGYEAADAVSEPLPQSASARPGAVAAVSFTQFAAYRFAGMGTGVRPAFGTTKSRHRFLDAIALQGVAGSPFAPFVWTPAATQAQGSSVFASTVAGASAGPVSAVGSTVDAVKAPLQVVTSVTDGAPSPPPIQPPQPPPLPVPVPTVPPVPSLPPAPTLPPAPPVLPSLP